MELEQGAPCNSTSKCTQSTTKYTVNRYLKLPTYPSHAIQTRGSISELTPFDTADPDKPSMFKLDTIKLIIPTEAPREQLTLDHLGLPALPSLKKLFEMVSKYVSQEAIKIEIRLCRIRTIFYNAVSN